MNVEEQQYLMLKAIVEKELSCSAHNMEHVMRVYNLCLKLAKNELGVDLEVLKTAALLHDIARVKEDTDDSGRVDHATLGSEMAGRILTKLRYPKAKIGQVKHCIASHRFRRSSGTGDKNAPRTKEAKLLFDADKLDAIGAVGLARSFMIAGQYGERLYSDAPLPDYVRDNTIGRKADGRIKEISKHAPNIEFETKFKRIPGRLHTRRARELARKRILFMERFFRRLGKELGGKA